MIRTKKDQLEVTLKKVIESQATGSNKIKLVTDSK
jgi:hypothetical protein